MKRAPTAGYFALAFVMDEETGAVEFDGQEPIRGQRVVWTEGELAGGPRYYVVRRPPSRYHSLDRMAYAPAEFAIYEADYGVDPVGYDLRQNDAPWVRVHRLVSFPISAGTKQGIR